MFQAGPVKTGTKGSTQKVYLFNGAFLYQVMKQDKFELKPLATLIHARCL